jgi:hypothetical protein
MTDEEIEQKRKELVEINKMESFQERKKRLKELQKEVGASLYRVFVKGDENSLSELTDNIHYALQTASMINMSKTAAKNYKIALTATIIAILSMLAAWVAVLIR